MFKAGSFEMHSNSSGQSWVKLAETAEAGQSLGCGLGVGVSPSSGVGASLVRRLRSELGAPLLFGSGEPRGMSLIFPFIFEKKFIDFVYLTGPGRGSWRAGRPGVLR